MAGYIFSSSEAKRVADTVRANEGEVQRRLPPRPKKYVPHGGGGVSGGDSGGSSGSSSDCCDAIYSRGSVDSNSFEWATDYLITGAAAPLADITVTDQGSDTWESDTIDVTCTVDDSEETDEYTATMVVSGGGVGGVPAGGIVLTIAMTLGGDSGDAICCDSLSTGFVHKYTNTKPVANPLAGFKLKPMQTGTVGQNCENVVCELCVVPSGIAACGEDGCESAFAVRVSINADGPLAALSGDYLCGETGCVSGYYDCFPPVFDTCAWLGNVLHYEDSSRRSWDYHNIDEITHEGKTFDAIGVELENFDAPTLKITPKRKNSTPPSPPAAAGLGVWVGYNYPGDGISIRVPCSNGRYQDTFIMEKSGSNNEGVYPSDDWPLTISVTLVRDYIA